MSKAPTMRALILSGLSLGLLAVATSSSAELFVGNEFLIIHDSAKKTYRIHFVSFNFVFAACNSTNLSASLRHGMTIVTIPWRSEKPITKGENCLTLILTAELTTCFH